MSMKQGQCGQILADLFAPKGLKEFLICTKRIKETYISLLLSIIADCTNGKSVKNFFEYVFSDIIFIMKLLYLNAGKNIEISNTQKYAILFSFWRRSRGSVDQIENYSSFLRYAGRLLISTHQ